MIYRDNKINRPFHQEYAKRYTPKKLSNPMAEDRTDPDFQKLESDVKPEDGVVILDGGVMMTTSEILDFSEGTDSKV